MPLCAPGDKGDVMRSAFVGIIFGLTIISGAPSSAEPRWPSIGQTDTPTKDWTGFYTYTPTMDWTGFYAGLNGGFGFAHATANGTIAGFNASASQDLNGAVGGGQIGYNWRTGAIVLGIEADIQASGQSNDTLLCPASFCGVDFNLKNKLPWFATFRGRAGYAFERFLVYATGGLAYAQLNSTLSASAGGVTVDLVSWSDTRPAWTLGAGVEFLVSRNWSTKLEYLYMDTGNFQTSLAVPGIGTLNPTLRVSDQIIRAGLNYRF